MSTILDVQNLSISFADKKAVKNLSFKVVKGKTTALVGESGSGKTVSALTILKLLNANITGKIILDNEEILDAPEYKLQQMRGSKAAIIFQEPMSSLNPLHTIGKQISEILRLHKKMSKQDAQAKAIKLLKEVGFKSNEIHLDAYPYELSGGQRQRVMIAMALAGEPDLLIADEPTTALDVTIQASIINLLIKLQKKFDMAILFISHNLGLVKTIADYIYVMKDGKLVEEGTTKKVLEAPTEAYTIKLINSFPKGKPQKLIKKNHVLIEAKNITVKYNNFTAVNNLSFIIKNGECLGVIGESGSGKTTLGMAMLRLLLKANITGEFFYDNTLITQKNINSLRKNMQIVFQDPYSSLNPRMTVEQIIGEGLEIHFPTLNKQDRHREIALMLDKVELPKTALSYYPHEFSGGQRQRIALARALILKPKFIILDEPTSALDVTVGAQILDLLKELKKELQLSYMLITHDISIVKVIAEEVMVMRNGKRIEYGNNREILISPKTPYTKKLISSALITELK